MAGSFEVDAIKFSFRDIGAGLIVVISGSDKFTTPVLSGASELFCPLDSFKWLFEDLTFDDLVLSDG
jgi:hypothetical protein